MARLNLPSADELRILVDSEGRLAVRVTPNAKADRVMIEEGQVKVRVTVAPEDGKANKAVITLLAKALGVSKSSLSIIRGETARDKLIQLR